jgi:RNA polymerase sigma factor (sigma-70 family)
MGGESENAMDNTLILKTNLYYEDIYQEYYPRVCRQLLYLVGDKSLAEDLAQESFFKFYTSPPENLDNIGGWLIKVATNKAYNFLRSEKCRQAKNEDIQSAYLDTFLSLDEIFFRNEEVRQVRVVLNNLKPRDRICLLLKFSGYSYKEIAEVIEVEMSSIGTILNRAMKRFKDQYEQGGN